jgi:hypothetical protein
MICKNTDLLRTLVKKWRNGHMVFCTWLDSEQCPNESIQIWSLSQELQGLGKTGVDTKTMPWLALVI